MEIFIENNFIEVLYLNYFKNKYFNLYNNKKNKFLPIQNTNTKICSLYNFYFEYKLCPKIYIKIKKK